MCVTFVEYSWNNQGIFLYSIFPEHYFGIPWNFIGNFPRIYWEYLKGMLNISRECSTNIPQAYICPMGNGWVRKVATFIKGSMFDVWHSSISLNFVKDLKINRLINVEYQHKSNSVTEGYALFIYMDHKHGLYSIFYAWTMK